MRATLLDELHKAYVVTARAKGVAETRLLFRYPVRVALNPQISTVGWLLPEIVSGDAIVSVVMSLPTIGPLLLGSLLSQDMYLAGSVILILTFLTLVGTFVSDLLLGLVGPADSIRMSARAVMRSSSPQRELDLYTASQWQLMWHKLRRHRLVPAVPITTTGTMRCPSRSTNIRTRASRKLGVASPRKPNTVAE